MWNFETSWFDFTHCVQIILTAATAAVICTLLLDVFRFLDGETLRSGLEKIVIYKIQKLDLKKI